MAILNWSDIVEVSTDEAKQDLLDLLDSLGFAATSWQEGSLALLAVEMSALIWSRVSSVAVTVRDNMHVPTAFGEGLTRLSRSHYDNEREKAVATRRLITLACAAGQGPHVIDVGDIVVSDDTGQTFRNVEGNGVVYPVNLSSGGGPITFRFEAEIAGSAGNVANGEVNQLVTTLAGVTVTADVIEREGVDQESDPRLRQRNTSKWALLTELELIDDAVENIVLNASPTIAVVRIDSQNPRGAGTVNVWIAGALTTASVDDVNAAQGELNKRAFGPQPPDPLAAFLVQSAPPAPLDITGTVYYSGAAPKQAVQQAIEDALLDFLETIPLGGFDYAPGPANVVPINDIEAVIKSAKVGGVQPVKTVVLELPSGNFAVPSFAKVTQGTWLLSLVPVNNG